MTDARAHDRDHTSRRRDADRGHGHVGIDVRDGHRIVLAAAEGIRTVFLTGRSSRVVARRAAELGVQRVYQGALDKGDVTPVLMWVKADDEAAIIVHVALEGPHRLGEPGLAGRVLQQEGEEIGGIVAEQRIVVDLLPAGLAPFPFAKQGVQQLGQHGFALGHFVLADQFDLLVSGGPIHGDGPLRFFKKPAIFSIRYALLFVALEDFIDAGPVGLDPAKDLGAALISFRLLEETRKDHLVA